MANVQTTRWMIWRLTYAVKRTRCTRRGSAPANESETGSRNLPPLLRSASIRFIIRLPFF